ncbi:MAG: protein kinase [Deltaproteobacteria bacterium]|nr:protein kinase [Deltaproteobacteria bacterium]
MIDLDTLAQLEDTLSQDKAITDAFVQSPLSSIRDGHSVGVFALESLRALRTNHASALIMHDTLGEGGMGVVKLGTQRSLDRPVAIKTMRPENITDASRLQVLREAWITGKLEHPNIVPIYELSLDEHDTPVIVMKRIEGVPWSVLLGDPQRVREKFKTDDPIEWHLRLLISVCNAVAFAHARGVLHRDLKPDNVMVGAFGEIYVLDWGIAVSLVEDPSQRLPSVYELTGIAGTPAYMAPEMLSPELMTLTERTDVYLLGAMLYEVFAGVPPHEGPSLQAMLSRIVLSEPVFASGFPSEARALCKRAMARDPSARFASVEELKTALEDYLEHRDSRRIAHDARKSLVALEAVISQTEESHELRTVALYNLLGECRFGFRAALDAWPENRGAIVGLDRALGLVAAYEAREGDARAAAVLLREMTEVAPELAQEVERAVRAREAEEQRLRAMAQDLDPSIGSRTRMFLGAAFGLGWSVLPLLHYLNPGENGYEYLIAFNVVVLCMGAAAWYWARETLTRTAHNRRLVQSVGIVLCVGILLAIGAQRAGIPMKQTELVYMPLWALCNAMLAVHVERWFGYAALADAVAFLVAARFPSVQYVMMSLCNVVLTIGVVAVWLPKQDLVRMDQRRREIQQAIELRRAGRAAMLEARRSSRAPAQSGVTPASVQSETAPDAPASHA